MNNLKKCAALIKAQIMLQMFGKLLVQSLCGALDTRASQVRAALTSMFQSLAALQHQTVSEDEGMQPPRSGLL